MIYIGNHVSSSKGYEAMGKQEVALGGDTFAFFTRNPRGGSAKEIKDEDVQRLLTLMKDHSFGPLVAHAPYTMNVCAAKEDIRKFSVEMLKAYGIFARCLLQFSSGFTCWSGKRSRH